VLAEPRAPKGDVTGWMVTPGDAGELAAALRRALSMTQEDRAAMGARARKRASSQFSVARMQRQTLAVYDRLLRSTLAAQFAARSVA
jgi:glycosyltransferase involved in cell wall biosynthesis